MENRLLSGSKGNKTPRVDEIQSVRSPFDVGLL
jgi:hypothetical protein